jgi:hypothetical protein
LPVLRQRAVQFTEKATLQGASQDHFRIGGDTPTIELQGGNDS